ncbi:MAG TPA: hypothetical protein VF018_05015 [Acidobacteriaceae bacterium]
MRRATIPICAAILLSLSSTGCGQTQVDPKRIAHSPTPPVAPAVKVAPSTPLDVKASELGGPTWDKHWDIFIERSLPPAMLTRQVPRDVRRYCPAFYTMSEEDKRAWWAYLFQAMAAAEAGLNASTNVRHTEPEVAVPDHVTGRIVHQQGLLQLTYEDSKRYGCDFDWRADKYLPAHDPKRTILNPERNLACGIRILSHQIIDQQKPIFTSTSYWATLQPGTPSFRVFEKQMTNPPAACQLHTHAQRPATEGRQIANQQSHEQ